MSQVNSRQTKEIAMNRTTSRVFGAVIVFLAAAALFGWAGTAQAETYYWDVNGATAGFSTVVGAWNGTSAFWNTDPAGGAGTLIAIPTLADDLIIPQATTKTGSLTVSGTQNARSITFAANVGPTVNITGGTIVIGGTGTNSGIFEASTGANTVSSALTLNSAVSGFSISDTSSGLLTIWARSRARPRRARRP